MMKVALVTASSAGLGAAIAKTLAVAGMRIVINFSSNAERANKVVAEMEAVVEKTPGSASEPRFAIIRADLGKKSDIQRLVAEAVAKMGHLDVVVSNGGWTRIRDFNDLDDNSDEEDWDKCFDINVKSHLWLLQASRKYLESNHGSFTTIASVAGVKPSGSSIVRSTLLNTMARLIYFTELRGSFTDVAFYSRTLSPRQLRFTWSSV